MAELRPEQRPVAGLAAGTGQAVDTASELAVGPADTEPADRAAAQQPFLADRVQPAFEESLRS